MMALIASSRHRVMTRRPSGVPYLGIEFAWLQRCTTTATDSSAYHTYPKARIVLLYFFTWTCSNGDARMAMPEGNARINGSIARHSQERVCKSASRGKKSRDLNTADLLTNGM